jgi:alkanesulfonate monooxygenase SsuD/methylene tetrahydromethanopterin reductase-like flavin-dependent oxidoreductase (luciferase family)
MLRMGYVSRDEADTREKVGLAYANHQRFVNVFTTPGIVTDGAILPIDVSETPSDIRRNLIVGTPQECVDKLGIYAELGIDDIQINMNFGTPHRDVMASLERLAAHVIPHFAKSAATGG